MMRIGATEGRAASIRPFKYDSRLFNAQDRDNRQYWGDLANNTPISFDKGLNGSDALPDECMLGSFSVFMVYEEPASAPTYEPERVMWFASLDPDARYPLTDVIFTDLLSPRPGALVAGEIGFISDPLPSGFPVVNAGSTPRILSFAGSLLDLPFKRSRFGQGVYLHLGLLTTPVDTAGSDKVDSSAFTYVHSAELRWTAP